MSSERGTPRPVKLRSISGRPKGCAPARLTWSLTPHSPAGALAGGPCRSEGSPTPALSRCLLRGPGQGLLLNRSMLGDQGSPYVGRFARGWHRLPGLIPGQPQTRTGAPPEYRHRLRDVANPVVPEGGPSPVADPRRIGRP